MSTRQIIAALLIAAGILALVYKGFTYTKETHDASLGPLELSVTEKEHVNIPVWVGVAAIIVGGVLLIPARGRRTSDA